MSGESAGQINTVMQEDRLFSPPADFAERAHIGSLEQYQNLWNEAQGDIEAFWGSLAKEELHWFEPFEQILDWQPPLAKWFVGGKTNVSHNCLDVHLDTDKRDKTAILWEGEPGDTRSLTYAELHREVCKFANVLRQRGIQPGDVVSIYMPMVPELAIAMLACARVGAVHSVIFGGFSSEAIADRNNDASPPKCRSRLMPAGEGAKQLPLKATVDEALEKSPSVESCIVRAADWGRCPRWLKGRDFWWDALMEGAAEECSGRRTR